MLNEALPHEITSADALPNLLTVPEVAVILRCSIKTVYRRIRIGMLPAIEEGGRYLIDSDTIRAWLITKLIKPKTQQSSVSNNTSMTTLTLDANSSSPSENTCNVSNEVRTSPANLLEIDIYPSNECPPLAIHQK